MISLTVNPASSPSFSAVLQLLQIAVGGEGRNGDDLLPVWRSDLRFSWSTSDLLSLAILPCRIREVGFHEALIGAFCLLHAGISNEEQVDLLFFPSVLGEYGFRPPAQV